MYLIRESWRELWQRNRGGGVLMLAFWYTMLTTFYQYLVISRLGPSFPKSFSKFLSHPGTTAVLPHLSSSLLFKLGLVYLTFILIIWPFALGGLYGGIAEAMKKRPDYTPILSFFRFGYHEFWRGLAQVVLALLYFALTLVVLGFLYAGLGSMGPIGTTLFVILFFAILVWTMGTVLFWFGHTFGTGLPPSTGFIPALRWAATHLSRLYTEVLLLIGLLIAALLVIDMLAAVPVIGVLVMIIGEGMIIPAFLAIYALLMYRQSEV
ncbi:hypothetical protein [Sulfobacillus harzensis]|uniref:Glycerophosphoryl diester phosphodiesterase membrane domain-containing protein n=1 Tax=Sulfobacillus harzensis TaxID=2729629 RepID=A0A7Y0L2H4_9FIRM|nr:hypothetical protein [Sulfobacillus harzensis]NMP22088.1 hypothetical protein [Sulfobacillus harzensis]